MSDFRDGDYDQKAVDVIHNLSHLVRRLCYRLKKHEPDSKVANQAIDYLLGEGLQGSILRGTAKEAVTLLPELLDRLQATNIKAAIEQLDEHFRKDKELLDAFIKLKKEAVTAPTPDAGISRREEAALILQEYESEHVGDRLRTEQRGWFSERIAWLKSRASGPVTAAQPDETMGKIRSIISDGTDYSGEFNGDPIYAIEEIRKAIGVAAQPDLRALIAKWRNSAEYPISKHATPENRRVMEAVRIETMQCIRELESAIGDLMSSQKRVGVNVRGKVAVSLRIVLKELEHLETWQLQNEYEATTLRVICKKIRAALGGAAPKDG